MSSGKCKLKQETTTHLLEWPKSGTPTIPNAGENLETIGTLHSLLVGMQNHTAFGKLLVSYKT